MLRCSTRSTHSAQATQSGLFALRLSAVSTGEHALPIQRHYPHKSHAMHIVTAEQRPYSADALSAVRDGVIDTMRCSRDKLTCAAVAHCAFT